MSSRSPILILLAPALALAGCQKGENLGVESVHQPVVTRTDYVLDLATSGYGLAPGEPQRLAGWMAAMRPSFGDHVYLDSGDGGSAGAREVVAGEAARYGLILGEGAPVTVGAIAPGTVRVVLTRASAAVPGCPDFSGIDMPNFDGHTGRNYGCASNANLAAMVANPNDLVRGQPGAETSDPATAVKAIDTFRKAAPTGAGGLKSQSTGGSN